MNEYEYIPDEEVMSVSSRIIEQHMKALTALGNAESIEDGKKYFADDD